jgi:hypothetical protein
MTKVGDHSVHAGHTISIQVNGREVGRGQGFSARRGFRPDGVYQIGSIYPQEHVPLRYECTITLDRFLIRKKELLGATSANIGNLKEEGFAAIGTGDIDGPGGDIMAMDLFDIVIRDKFDATGLVRRYIDCTLVDYAETVRANAIAGENATFVCRRSRNT